MNTAFLFTHKDNATTITEAVAVVAHPAGHPDLTYTGWVKPEDAIVGKRVTVHVTTCNGLPRAKKLVIEEILS